MKLNLAYLIILAGAALVQGESPVQEGIPRESEKDCASHVRFTSLNQADTVRNGIDNSIYANKFGNLERVM
ncbi:hypothetical protein GGI43DRAFT_410747 [Trichoderma evansii]